LDYGVGFYGYIYVACFKDFVVRSECFDWEIFVDFLGVGYIVYYFCRVNIII
jgi:hypothetical protein